jgi:hypothetical protein
VNEQIWMCKWCFTPFIGKVPPGTLCPWCCTNEEPPDAQGEGHYRITNDGTIWVRDDGPVDGGWYL